MESITWKALQNWMINNLEYNFNFTICEILFGIYLIYMSKWYINIIKSLIKPLNFIGLLQIIRNNVASTVLAPEADGFPVQLWH